MNRGLPLLDVRPPYSSVLEPSITSELNKSRALGYFCEYALISVCVPITCSNVGTQNGRAPQLGRPSEQAR